MSQDAVHTPWKHTRSLHAPATHLPTISVATRARSVSWLTSASGAGPVPGPSWAVVGALFWLAHGATVRLGVRTARNSAVGFGVHRAADLLSLVCCRPPQIYQHLPREASVWPPHLWLGPTAPRSVPSATLDWPKERLSPASAWPTAPYQ